MTSETDLPARIDLDAIERALLINRITRAQEKQEILKQAQMAVHLAKQEALEAASDLEVSAETLLRLKGISDPMAYSLTHDLDNLSFVLSRQPA